METIWKKIYESKKYTTEIYDNRYIRIFEKPEVFHIYKTLSTPTGCEAIKLIALIDQKETSVDEFITQLKRKYEK